jgi:hypothetical protein
MVRTIFNGTFESGTDSMHLEVSSFPENLIRVVIIDTSTNYDKDFKSIFLDKRTAIKLHRELKKQISFINDIED